MTYKYARVMSAALITLVGLAGKPGASQSVIQPNNQQPEAIISPKVAGQNNQQPESIITPKKVLEAPTSQSPEPTTGPNDTKPDLSQPLPTDIPPNETSAPVPEMKLSYKLETFNSRVMGGRRTYGVSLPPGYKESPDQRYPVIFLLHGGHGTPNSWFEKEKGSVLTTLKKLYTENKLPPSIIITPDGYDQRGTTGLRDPEYIDGPNGRMITHIGNELVKVVQSRYRTLPAPNYWAIGGLSSGGWGAINIGLHYTEHFSILFSHSGYFRDKTGSQNSPIDLVKTLSSQERRNLKIYLDTGKSDSAVLSQNRQFHAVLNQLKIKNVLREFPGEHTWRYWRQHLNDSLMFIDEQFEWAPEPK